MATLPKLIFTALSKLDQIPIQKGNIIFAQETDTGSTEITPGTQMYIDFTDDKRCHLTTNDVSQDVINKSIEDFFSDISLEINCS